MNRAQRADTPSVDLLRLYAAKETTDWKVSRAVGNVRNNRPGLLKPIEGVVRGFLDSPPLRETAFAIGARHATAIAKILAFAGAV